MGTLIKYLDGIGIKAKNGEVAISEHHEFKNAFEFFSIAIKDILEARSAFYRDAIAKGIVINIDVQVAENAQPQFNIKEQLNLYKEDVE